MILDCLGLYLVAMPGALAAWCELMAKWHSLTCPGVLGLADFGSKDQYTSINDISFQDSNNPVENYIRSLDGGNVTLTYGGAGQSQVADNIPLVLALLGFLFGIFILSGGRK